MLNRKQVCESSRTCETGKTFNGTATFFLMPVYNNRFDPKFQNPKTEVLGECTPKTQLFDELIQINSN